MMTFRSILRVGGLGGSELGGSGMISGKAARGARQAAAGKGEQ